MQFSQKQIKIAQYLVAALAVIFFVLFFVLHKYPESKGAGYGKIDFAVFYVAGATITGSLDTPTFNLKPTDMFLDKKNFRAGIKQVRTQNGGTRYLYLPQSALLFTPTSFMPMKYANVMWMVLIGIAFITTYYITIWGLIKDSIWKFRYSLLLILLPFSSPVQGLFSTGQVNSIVWLLLMLVFLGLARKKSLVPSAALALAVTVKVFPVLLGPYLLIRKEWKVIGYSVGFFLLLFVVSIPVFSWEAYRFYFENVLSSVIAGDFISFTGTSAFSNIVMWIKHGWFDYTGLKRKKMIRIMEGVWQWVTLGGLVLMYSLWLKAYEPVKEWRKRLSTRVPAFARIKDFSGADALRHTEHAEVLDYSIIMLFFLTFSKAIHQQYHFWLLPFMLLLLSYPLKKKYWAYHVAAGVGIVLTQFWKQFGLIADNIIVVKPATVGLVLMLLLAVLMRMGVQFSKKQHIDSAVE